MSEGKTTGGIEMFRLDYTVKPWWLSVRQITQLTTSVLEIASAQI